MAAKPLAPCLAILFNKSLKTGVVPQDWRTANISPVFKKGERYKPANYRPVSLTCICSKMLEHIVVSNLMKHFDQHNILTDCQHGFRSKRSCETQLLSLTQELHEQLENKKQIDMIVLDFSKAFDKVAHHRLLAKLDNFGVRGSLHQWIASFLLDRKQRVVVDGEASGWVKMESGVPQGTVLGPILFLAFINDLPEAVNSRVRLFADDCVMYRPIASTHDCTLLQEDLDRLSCWEQKWCMTFNASKCSSITITRKKNKVIHDYVLHDTVLERTDTATYLGVELTSKLTWATHITRMCAKANRNLGFLRRNLQIQNRHIKEMAYKGLVRPVIEYCSPVWNPHQQKYIDKIEMVQRRAARYTLNRNHISSVSSMLQELDWETTSCRRSRADLICFFKVQHKLIAVPSPSLIQRPNRQYSSSYYQIPFCSTEAYRQSFFPRAVRLWNSLPPTVQSLDSLDAFKAAISKLRF